MARENGCVWVLWAKKRRGGDWMEGSAILMEVGTAPDLGYQQKKSLNMESDEKPLGIIWVFKKSQNHQDKMGDNRNSAGARIR